MNAKRIYRLYSEEGLSIRPKTPRRKRAWRYRSARPAIGAPNDCWAMDFMSDALFDGRPFRLLTVVGCHSRESLAIVPKVNFRAFQVIEVSIGWRAIGASQRPSAAITAPSLPGGCSTNGPT